MSQPSDGGPRRRPWLRRILIGALVLVLLAAAGTVWAYKHLQSNIEQIDLRPDLGHHRPKVKIPGALNVLVMGDDTRKGAGNHVAGGGKTPGNSDTTLLLHLSKDHNRAYGISIPRDAMVHRPSCRKKPGKGRLPPGLIQFNAAYEEGGPACTIKTVEKISSVHINHYVVVDFNGFKQMVDALGGVQVCLPYAVDDPIGKIHMRKGTYDVSGQQALDYVRERHAFGDGSDIGRMKRQQTFVASMVNKAMSMGTLANPKRLYSFLDAATKSLTTDPGFANLMKLAALANSLKSIGLAKVQFVTAPFEPYPADPNRLQLAPRAENLWRKIREDKPLTRKLRGDVVRANEAPGSPTNKPPGKNKKKSGTASERRQAQAEKYGLCA